jgi:opacity protein-like surface antigen
MKKSLPVVSWVGAVSLAALLVAVPAAAVADPSQTAQQTEMDLAVKVGVGAGVPYGVLGVGIDVGIPHFSLVGGFGTTAYGPVGWSAGVRAYLFDRTRRFRPHLTAVYGTTMIVDVVGGDSYTVNGFGFYASLDHDIGPIGGLILTYGIGLVTNEPPGAGVEDPRFSVKVMFGLNYRFGGRQ